MFRFDDNSPEARRWRMQQMIGNNAIEGIEKDPELVALIGRWDDEGVPDEEQIARLFKMAEAPEQKP
ncbi:hypothetical protein GOA89_32570 [Sinorhizobium meliloti]|nr:hypothetical protein [Sinorhizobium meliloti]MDW9850855.1 hypothetical protein [Sinorhizobium meliloti]MDX0147651.1 hypothetical protein [Sinorhizobium meliloti]MDX0153920.1 hypothetical protein [Sinorhizobium meliloti]MDX0172832.1 hypothetical protein [Sinorhizobium meliloti]